MIYLICGVIFGSIIGICAICLLEINSDDCDFDENEETFDDMEV